MHPSKNPNFKNAESIAYGEEFKKGDDVWLLKSPDGSIHVHDWADISQNGAGITHQNFVNRGAPNLIRPEEFGA